MDPVDGWGVAVIRWIQAVRPEALDPLVIAVTLVGSGVAYLLLIPLVTWCLRADLGGRLLAVFAISSFVNDLLKSWWAIPRPYVAAPELQLVMSQGYSFPSGHAQNAAALLGTVALAGLGGRTTAAAVGLVAAIGMSRVYLGVHFPIDVVAGWLIGAGIAVGFERLRRSLGGRAPVRRLTAAAAILAALLLAHDNPAAMTSAGLLTALAAVPRMRSLDFQVRAEPELALLRAALGLGPAIACLLLTRWSTLGHLPLARYGCYLAYGWWTVAGAPWLFERLGLAGESPPGA